MTESMTQFHKKSDPSARQTSTALVMSSFVSASRVGATASAFCLRRLGVETLVLPTVMLGRHPGWGTPGGSAVDTATLRDMWNAIKQQELSINAVLTGYMASEAHIALAADIIKDVKTANPHAIILVDPVMGDHGRLYVPDAVAQAIKTDMLPLAHICTPNFWELSYLTGEELNSAQDAKRAAQTLGSNVLVTSVMFGEEIGAIYCPHNNHPALAVSHPKFSAVPHGGGDSLAGTFLAHRLNGLDPKDSLAKSVSSIYEIISHAVETDAGEMPLIREQDSLINALALTVKELP